MEKLGIHIVELLNENPEVYLPGIGLFKKERLPAAFDENTNSFTAPGQRIVLLSQEKGSANLLIESIRQAEEITADESEEQLKKVIGSILLEVNEKGKVDIPGLGKLVKEQENLNLIQDNSLKAKFPFYKSIKELNLISPSAKADIPVEKDAEPALENTFIDEEVEETAVDTPQELELENRSLNWLWPVLIILVVLGAGAYWYITTPKTADVIALKETPQEAILPDTLEADTLPLEIDSFASTAVDSLDKTLPAPPAPISKDSVATPGKTTFEIIVVSFGKKADAQEYVETMKARGHQFHVLENRRAGNQIKVSAGAYPTEEEAQISLNKIRESFAKEAWIYKKIH